MLLTKPTDLRAATKNFLIAHRNCPVEITISGLDSHYGVDCGMLRRIKVLKGPDGRAELNIVLRRRDHSSSVKTIRNIHCLNVTGRMLSVYSDNGIQQNRECQALHSAIGREKLLLIRHLAEMAQTLTPENRYGFIRAFASANVRSAKS